MLLTKRQAFVVALVQVALAQLVYKPLAIAGMHTELSMLSRPDETSGAVQAYLALARAQG